MAADGVPSGSGDSLLPGSRRSLKWFPRYEVLRILWIPSCPPCGDRRGRRGCRREDGFGRQVGRPQVHRSALKGGLGVTHNGLRLLRPLPLSGVCLFAGRFRSASGRYLPEVPSGCRTWVDGRGGVNSGRKRNGESENREGTSEGDGRKLQRSSGKPEGRAEIGEQERMCGRA